MTQAVCFSYTPNVQQKKITFLMTYILGTGEVNKEKYG